MEEQDSSKKAAFIAFDTIFSLLPLALIAFGLVAAFFMTGQWSYLGWATGCALLLAAQIASYRSKGHK